MMINTVLFKSQDGQGMKYVNNHRNIDIRAGEVNIGRNVTFGKNIKVRCKGTFEIGDFSRLGDDTEIYGNNVQIGKHLFNSSGLRVGGGGRQHPQANLIIGDRCTIHNNFINVCEPVLIGHDVGLSPEVSLITHGYWLSVLEGFPASFAGIRIKAGTIVGYRSCILMGVIIADRSVIAAHSVVTRSLGEPDAIYAGNPARMLREVVPMTQEEREEKVRHILDQYQVIARYHGLEPQIVVKYPIVEVNDFCIDVETFEYAGNEDADTDDFRDYIRKWGIRVYTERPFKSHFEWEGACNG